MPTMTISREDLLRGKTVAPGWYKMRIKSVEDSEASTDQSTNTTVSLVIIQDGPFKDVPLRRVFNEKAPGFAIPLVQAITGKRMDEKGGTFDLSNAIGREVFGYVKNSTYQGRMKNDVEDFLPVGEDGSLGKLG